MLCWAISQAASAPVCRPRLPMPKAPSPPVTKPLVAIPLILQELTKNADCIGHERPWPLPSTPLSATASLPLEQTTTETKKTRQIGILRKSTNYNL
jgi:hypothetical protein